MECKDIQDKILTEYLDGEMNAAQRDVVDAHLAQCPACREFLSAARQALVEPFAVETKTEVPEVVWLNVKSEIVQTQESDPVVGNFWKDLIHAFDFRWVPIAGLTFALALLFVPRMVRQVPVVSQMTQSQVEEQGEYLAYVMGYSDDETDEESQSFYF